jgi:aerobic-type carbon monoxide dehydrogenase small subunit (CoxS/CutS family)
MKQEIVLIVNGSVTSVTVDPEKPLLWVLRDDLKLTGTKFGCGEGACGACSVLIDGEVYRSCMVAVGDLGSGEKIVTIEGLGAPGDLSALQKSFMEHTAFGCGYCTPGMIVTATALLKRNPDPTTEEIVSAMNDNLCRCASYPNIIEAIKDAAASDGNREG